MFFSRIYSLAKSRLRRIRVSGHSVLAASLVVAIGFMAVGGAVMGQMRRAAWQEAQRQSANLAATLAADIARNIELYDLSLQAVVDNIRLPELNGVSKQLRQLVLFDRAATARHLGGMFVIDRNGEIIIDSRTLNVARRNVGDRDYFEAHRSNPDVGLYIGRPFVAPSGRVDIGLSRRLSNPDGSFAGVVAGALRLSYFQDLFGRVELSPGSIISLTRLDGALIAREPALASASPGRNLSAENGYRSVPGRSGSFESTAVTDGVSRLYSFQQVGNFPLRIYVGLSRHAVFAEWRREAMWIGGVVFALALAIIILALLTARELRKRAEAERQLAVVAATDALTGLSNRRVFKSELERLWTQSVRQQRPIALLMIDVDRFKSYNDLHGHLAGDDALAAIASCIAECRGSAADVIARYGGEEFAVLAAGLSRHDAFRYGERIRRCIGGTTSNGMPLPTVSVGVASTVPDAGEAPTALIADADAALYRAKNNGRNRTERHDRLPGGERSAAAAA